MPTRVGRRLLACLSATTRTLVASIAILTLAARLTTVATAIAIVNADVQTASILGVAAGGVYILVRVFSALARRAVESDLYRALVGALLKTDVLRIPTSDVQRIVFDASHDVPALAVDTTPTLCADLIACIAVAPLVARALPGRVLLLAAIALFAAMATLMVLRGMTRRLQERALEAYSRVYDEVVVAIEGRLEIVARGGEDLFAEGFERVLGRYTADTRRAAFGSALLGRAPLAIGAVVVSGVLVFDRSSRDAFTGAVLGQALLLAACLPIVLGVLFGAHDLLRGSTRIAPVAILLDAPARAERGRGAAPVAALPATIVVKDLAFAYEPGASLIFTDVSFEWKPPSPLVLAGPNGSGKSTLLRLLIGLRPPTRGTIHVAGEDLQSLDLVKLRRSVAFLPQRPYLGEPYTSLRDALHLGRSRESANKDEDAKALAALARVGLSDALALSANDPLSSTKIGELSAGQRQRVALARVLMQDASILLLDEPDANLDRAGIALIGDLVKELSAAGKMVAIAAHTTELAEEVSPLHVKLGIP